MDLERNGCKMRSKGAKGYLPLFITGLCLFTLLVTKFLLMSAGIVSGDGVLCFDVDSDDCIYIGTMNKIRVYRDGELLREIQPPTSRYYSFYIEDDKLIIGCASDNKGGQYDLNGNEISYGTYSFSDIEREASSRKNVTVNGHTYKLTNTLGITPYKIVRDGETVHQMSTADYIFNGLPFWVFLGFLSITLAVLILAKVSEMRK